MVHFPRLTQGIGFVIDLTNILPVLLDCKIVGIPMCWSYNINILE